MPLRIALLLCGLWLVSAASATGTPSSAATFCKQEIAVSRTIWLHNGFDAPPQTSAMMVDVIDGKLSQVRRQLRSLPAVDAAHWRQTAMVTAVYAQQAAEVNGLLDDGAQADRMAWMPPLRRQAYHAAVAGMKSDRRFGGSSGVDHLTKAGLLRNRDQSIGPALVVASGCADAATVQVLLQHHATVMAREAPDVVDALDAGVINGDPRIVKLLLDHGADPCAHDRLALQRRRGNYRPFIRLATAGRRAGLPDALTSRLTCPVVAAAH